MGILERKVDKLKRKITDRSVWVFQNKKRRFSCLSCFLTWNEHKKSCFFKFTSKEYYYRVVNKCGCKFIYLLLLRCLYKYLYKLQVILRHTYVKSRWEMMICWMCYFRGILQMPLLHPIQFTFQRGHDRSPTFHVFLSIYISE